MSESAPWPQVHFLLVSLSWKKKISQHDSLLAADSAAAISPALRNFSDGTLPAAAALAKVSVAVAAAAAACKQCYDSDGGPA